MRNRPLAAAAVTASLVVVAALLACSKPPGFGAAFEGEITMHTSHPGGPAEDLLVKAKGDRLRFDMTGPSGQQGHALFDPKANKVTMVMDAQKTFMDIDFSQPGAQPNVNPATSNVDKTGRHETIAGLDCEDWVSKDPSGRRSEVCIAPGIAFFDVSGLRYGSGVSPLGNELREKKLFPLRSVEYDAKGTEVSRMEVTKVEKKSLDDAQFTVPADYKKLGMNGLPAR